MLVIFDDKNHKIRVPKQLLNFLFGYKIDFFFAFIASFAVKLLYVLANFAAEINLEENFGNGDFKRHAR